MTVIEIEAKQYARIEIGALFVIEDGTCIATAGFDISGDDLPLPAGIFIAKSSRFLSSMFAIVEA